MLNRQKTTRTEAVVILTSSLALLGARALYADALVRVPYSDRRDALVIGPLNGDVDALAAGRRVQAS
jgi:hypothetical protein